MLTRRTFLAASAAPLVLANRAVAANDKLTLGFIGVGMMGRGHLGGFLGRKDVEVVAIADCYKTRLDSAVSMVEEKYADRKKSGEWKGVKALADFRQLLDDKSIDAVVIGTPDHWHANMAVLAARAGKHIYCEKPLTHNIAEGRWIVDEVKKAKVTFQVGSQQRSEFSNRFRAAVEMIWNGWIGTIKTIRIGVGVPNRPCDLPTQELPPGLDWDMWQGPAPERGYNEVLCPKGIHRHFPKWREYREYAGGYVADMGAHHFDIAQWALKMDNSGPVEINPPTDPKKLSGLTYTYANGVKMIHGEFEKGRDGKEISADCVFEGSEGTILVGRGQLDVRFKSGSKAVFPEKVERVLPSGDHRQNWLDAIKAGKTECICTPEIGHRTATVCHLGNLGYQLRRKLKWDPVKEEFANDEEANKLRSREPRAKWKVA
jgi:predicted dehydrogenase